MPTLTVRITSTKRLICTRCLQPFIVEFGFANVRTKEGHNVTYSGCLSGNASMDGYTCEDCFTGNEN